MRLDLEDPSVQDVAATVSQLIDGQNKAAVARDLGIARETVYRWERGDSQPTLQELAALARLAGSQVSIILNRQDPSLEDEVAELRQMVEGFYQGRSIVVDIFDRLHDSRDPEVIALLQRLRNLGFRPSEK